MPEVLSGLTPFNAAAAAATRNALGLGSAAVVASKAWRGTLHGLTLSNNVTDANNDIDIAAGVAWDNSSDALLDLASALTKRLDATHSTGTNQGGLDTGSKANNTWYHVWLIGTTGGTVDALFSTSATSPTMPGGFTLKRRIGVVRTNGSGNLIAFVQRGDIFRWKTPAADSNGTTVGTTAALFALTVPSGIEVEPILSACFGIVGGATIAVYVSSPDQDDLAVSLPVAWTHASLGVTDAAAPVGINYRLFTNTSRQVRVRSDTASTAIYIGTAGWIDTRGRAA